MRYLIRKLDDLIRKSDQVFEFNLEPDCILRLQVSRAPRLLQLPDLILAAGEPVLLIHLWNERLPVISRSGPDLSWARLIFRQFRHSLRLVAGYVRDHPELNEVRAVGGVTILVSSGLHEGGRNFLEAMGFTIFPYVSPLGRFGEFWENFYSRMIVWTFNPVGKPSRSLFNLRRSEIWMSRAVFFNRYG